jgi:hypothetical protein
MAPPLNVDGASVSHRTAFCRGVPVWRGGGHPALPEGSGFVNVVIIMVEAGFYGCLCSHWATVCMCMAFCLIRLPLFLSFVKTRAMHHPEPGFQHPGQDEQMVGEYHKTS